MAEDAFSQLCDMYEQEQMMEGLGDVVCAALALLIGTVAMCGQCMASCCCLSNQRDEREPPQNSFSPRDPYTRKQE